MTVPLWRRIQRESLSSLDALCTFLELDPIQCQKLASNKRFPFLLPLRLAHKIEKQTLDDPILRQFVPLIEEENKIGLIDPVGDCQAQQTPKCLHKYASRVLLIPTGACAMHCRYCFRQNFTYPPFQSGIEQEIAYIRTDPTIREVILSGGDPLSLGDEQLKDLIETLAEIPHLKRLRFHTRFPIGIPERITPGFLEILKKTALQTWFMIHCNHPRELDDEVLAALKEIQKCGIPVLSQSVLLRGINDSIAVQQNLCEKLVDHGIIPYYLHQLDPVQGAMHFEVPEKEGIAIIEGLRERLSGYAIPSYVREEMGLPSKTALH